MVKPTLIKVRLLYVEDKPQRYAAHTIKDNTLLGYCGRDGRITHPVADIAPGTLTDIIGVEDLRLPRKGLVRSMAAVNKMLEKPAKKAPKKEAKWVEVSRKELGLFVSGSGNTVGAYERADYCIIFEVTETLKTGKSTETRVRAVTGQSCRMQREGYYAFVSLYKTYASHAREHEDGKHVEQHQKCFHKDEVKDLDVSKTKGKLAP